MQYTITISGERLVVGAYSDTVTASQLNMVLTIDQTLDYGSFVVRNQTSTPYEVGDMVDIDITDGTNTNSYHFIVSADDVTQLPNGYYIHQVGIIELTKILEWHTESVRTFTQPVDYIDPETSELVSPPRFSLFQVVNRLQFTAPIERDDNLTNTRIFALDPNLIPRLNAIESPDFVFNNRNLKEILMEVFDFIGAIPRLTKISDSITLTADFYNERGAQVTEDSFHNMKRLDIKEYSTALEADIKNLYDINTTVVEPAPSSWKRVTSDEGLVKEDNAFLKTQFGIIDIVSFKVKDGQKIIDLTDYIVEKEAWDQLEFIKFGEALDTGNYRDNTLFFTRYSPNIDGMFEPAGIAGIENRLTFAIRSALIKANDPQGRGYVIDFRTVDFQIEYKALIDTRTEVKRVDTFSIKYDSQRISNQSDNVVRADRVLDRMQKMQQLLGNAQIMTSERLQDLSRLHELADYTADDYVLTTVEMICDKKHITAKYMWSKNFSRISDFIGVNSEYREYDIPANTFKRNIYIEDFVEIDLSQRPNTSYVTPLGIAAFANTFRNNPSGDWNKPVGTFVFDGEVNSKIDTETRAIVQSVSNYGGGTSLNFYSEFDQPRVAGFQLELVDGLNIGDLITPPGDNIDIPYTDDAGEVSSAAFQFAETFNISNEDIPNLPVIDKDEVANVLVDVPKHLIWKDKREEFALTYALHVVPLIGLETNVIVGKYLIEQNNLLKPIFPDRSKPIFNALDRFEVFTTTTPYSVTENRISRASDSVTIHDYTVLFYSDNDLTAGFSVTVSPAVPVGTTWGIRKKDTKELVLAVNQPENQFTTLYFTFRDRQTWVQYPKQTSQPTSIVKRPTQIALNPPSNNPTGNSIQIVWVDGNTDPVAQEFEFGISDDLVNWTVETQAPAVTNGYTFTGLDPYTNYTIRIRARIGTNYSEYAYFQATTTAPSPNAPTDLVLTLVGDRRILVEWEAEDDVFLHRIDLSTASDFSTILKQKQTFGVDTNVEFDFIDDGIEYATQYYIRVRVLRDGQFSGYTSDDITTADSPITSPPTITNVSISGSTVSYTLINTDTQLATLFSDFSSATTQRATNVRPNEAISVSQSFTNLNNTIFAKAQATNKSESQVVSIPFAADEAPDAPGIAVGGITSAVGVTTVNWVVNTGSPQADGFIIERNPNRNNQAVWGIISDTVPPTARSYEDRTRINGETTYTYRVVAYNRIGSAVSNERSITTIAMRPAAPSSLAVSQTQIISTSSASTVLTWQRNSTDETGFIIEWRETSTMANFIEIDGAAAAAATHYVIFDRVGSGTKSYLFRVRAFNEYGVSNPSNEALILI